MHWRLLLIPALWLALADPAPAPAQDPGSGGAVYTLTEVPLSQLSDPGNSALGQAALAVRPGEWKHAETDHFILHFFQNFVASQAAVELEYYYSVISKELHQDPSTWQRKSHVYIFENPADWQVFQKKAQLDPWTGGIHAEGNLFIVRDPSLKFEGRSLGHETAHLVLYRFFGSAIPLWLNEGYAENSSIRFYAGFEKERGYNFMTRSAVLTASNYIPLATLTSAATYPDDVTQVSIFYQESQRLVEYLRAQSTEGFVTFMDSISHGATMENALEKGFGARFPSLEDLDQEFSQYAERKYLPLAGG